MTNARRDRKTIETVQDDLIKAIKSVSVQEDGLTMMAIAEQMAKLSDSLTRTNSALVEISKVKAKEGPPPEDTKDSTDSIYDDISKAQQSGSDEKVN